MQSNLSARSLQLGIAASLTLHMGFAAALHGMHLLAPENLPPASTERVLTAVLQADTPLLKPIVSKPTPTARITNDSQPPPTAQVIAAIVPPEPPTPLLSPTEELATPIAGDTLAEIKKQDVLAEVAGSKAVAHYTVPTDAVLHYEGKYGGINAKGVLTWQMLGKEYKSNLNISGSVFGFTRDLNFKSEGKLNERGLITVKAEEKAVNGRVVAMHVDEPNKRVAISNVEGFQPHHADGKDLLSLISHLGILVQANPAWTTAGTAQDFHVYRPGGTRSWRYQSQGYDTINIMGKLVKAIYLKRVKVGESADFDNVHHIWLDPARHGTLLQLRLVDNKNHVTEIHLVKAEGLD